MNPAFSLPQSGRIREQAGRAFKAEKSARRGETTPQTFGAEIESPEISRQPYGSR